MDTFVSLKVFRQVVESGSFTAAADVLDMSVAMVSKHVMHLESRLGARLLNRTSRRVSLNDAGSIYYERCCEILNQLEEAESAINTTTQKPKGTLRLTAPGWFSNQHFASILTDYRRLYPDVHLDVLLSDSFVDLVEDGLDLALRISERIKPGPTARPLGTIEFVLAASPAYLERYGRPLQVEDLSGHVMLTYTYAPSRLFGLSEDEVPRWRLNNTSLIGHLAAQGAGVAVIPRVLLENESYRDKVEILLPQLKLPRPHLFAVTHGRRHLSDRVRSFVSFLEERLHSCS